MYDEVCDLRIRFLRIGKEAKQKQSWPPPQKKEEEEAEEKVIHPRMTTSICKQHK